MANKNNGGAFIPADDYTVTGNWRFEGTVTNAGTTTTSSTTATLTALTNQIATGGGSNITTSTYPASSGAVTLTFPNTSTTIVGTDTTNTLTNKTIASSATIPYAAGVAAGYKVARGVTALDGSNPTPVTTGLSTVVAATVSLEGTAAPGVGTSVLTVASTNYATGALAVYAWKVTATGDCTLIASTGTENFEWVAIGT